MDVQRDATDARRDPSSTDDLAGLEALFCWTHLCNRVYNETDARLFDNLCRMTCLVDSDVSLSPLGLI